MTIREFTWFPNVDSTCDTKPNVSSTKFGDGYELRVANGINNAPMKWSLKFTRMRAEALEIIAFLRSHGGVTKFQWTNPFEETGTYICREWKSSQGKGGVTEIDVDFEQVFES